MRNGIAGGRQWKAKLVNLTAGHTYRLLAENEAYSGIEENGMNSL